VDLRRGKPAQLPTEPPDLLEATGPRPIADALSRSPSILPQSPVLWVAV